MVQGSRLVLIALVISCAGGNPGEQNADDEDGTGDQAGASGSQGGGSGGDLGQSGGGPGGHDGQPNSGGNDAGVPIPSDAAKPIDIGGKDALAPDTKPAVVSMLADEKVVWNGDGIGNGSGSQWMGRGQEGKTTLQYADAQSHSSTHAVAFTMSNINYGEFGWGVQHTPANRYKKIAFWANMVPQPGKQSPGNALVTLRVGGGYAAPGGGRGVETIKYNKIGLRGGWQQIVIPMADIVGNPSGGNVEEILIGLTGCGSPTCAFTLFVDDISFGN